MAFAQEAGNIAKGAWGGLKAAWQGGAATAFGAGLRGAAVGGALGAGINLTTGLAGGLMGTGDYPSFGSVFGKGLMGAAMGAGLGVGGRKMAGNIHQFAGGALKNSPRASGLFNKASSALGYGNRNNIVESVLDLGKGKTANMMGPGTGYGSQMGRGSFARGSQSFGDFAKQSWSGLSTGQKWGAVGMGFGTMALGVNSSYAFSRVGGNYGYR